MKHPTGNVKPRRLAAPKPRKKVRLDLKRRPEPEPEKEFGTEKKSNFWKWVILVALLHVLVIGIGCLVYQFTPAPKPPEQFISLLPEGDVVKGTAGAQQAHKVGPTTSAPKVHHHESTLPPASKPPTAMAPIKPLLPPPALTPPPPEPSSFALDKPVVKPPPPTPKPKVRVDLTLADAPNASPDKPKIKHHPKKPVEKPTEDTADQDTADAPDSAGLSKEQIAEKLGDKLDEEGIKNATKTGTSGAIGTQQNPFSAYYQMIGDAIKDKWEGPSFTDPTALSPTVHIYVEKDGKVPPENVYINQSSGNAAYDNAALAAAKSLGFLREPLPDGCPPDIYIHIHPN